MQITLKREDLLKPLSMVAGVVERRQTLPILSNVLVRQAGNELRLSGTDMEVEIVVTMQEVDGADGEITLPARKWLDICRALPAEAKVEIRIDKQKATIKSGRSRFVLATMPAVDFPLIEAGEWDRTLKLEQRRLRRLFEKTQFCMAQQDVRYYLNGLLVEVEDKRLRGVATDGHRMALSDCGLAVASAGSKQVIVPRKGVHELLRLLDDSDGQAELRFGTNHLQMRLPGVQLTTKLIDGRFPEYDKVIPKNQAVKLELGREELRETLTRAAILSNEKYRGVRLSIGAGVMRVSAHNPEQEEAQEELPISYDGTELEIGFNVNYIIDAIGAITSDTVELGLTDANSSCTLASPEDKESRYVIMPMRL